MNIFNFISKIIVDLDSVLPFIIVDKVSLHFYCWGAVKRPFEFYKGKLCTSPFNQKTN